MRASRSALAHRLIATAIGLACASCIAIAVRAARSELASLEPTPHRVTRPLGDAWLARATDVALTSPRGVFIRGWRFPSTNGAAIVMVHGSSADRTQLLPEARLLTHAGYGVLLFDLPANGESTGQKRRGDEQEFLRVIVATLASSPDGQPQRIGGYGFSTGAAVLADFAASDARIRAVALAGCYTDTDEHIRQDYRRWGPLSGFPALWAARAVGLVALHPLRSVAKITPRSLLFIAGDADPVVSPDSAVRLYAAARQPKQLWMMHGVGHGRYADAGGREYAQMLVGFFDRALREQDIAR